MDARVLAILSVISGVITFVAVGSQRTSGGLYSLRVNLWPLATGLLVSSLMSAFARHVIGVGLNWLAARFEQGTHYQLEAQAASTGSGGD